MTEFSERLRRLRIAAGLSQADLAGDGLSASYVSLLESGKRTPSSEVVQKLVVRLGCSTTQLLDGHPSERDQRVELELAYARLAVDHGEAAEVERRLSALVAEDGLPLRSQDDALWLLAVAHLRLDNPAAACRILDDLFERSLRHDTHLPVTLVGLALVGALRGSGDLHRATVQGDRALSAAHDHHVAGSDDYFRLAATVMLAHMGLGDYTHAQVLAERFLTESQGSPRGQAAIYWNAARLAEHQGRLVDAIALYERATGLQTELGTIRDTPRLQLDLAAVLLLASPPQVSRASSLLDACFDALADLGSRIDRANWHRLRARAHLLAGDLDACESRARQAVDLVGPRATDDRAQALMVLADALRADRRDTEAETLLDDARLTLLALPPTRELSLIWRELADRLSAWGRLREASDAYRHALDLTGVRGRTEAVESAVRALRDRPQVGATLA